MERLRALSEAGREILDETQRKAASAPPDCSIVYSGDPAIFMKYQADTYLTFTKDAGRFSFVPIEQTEAGKWLDAQRIHRDEHPLLRPDGRAFEGWRYLSHEDVVTIWNEASRRYAQAAEGQVTAICFKSGPGSTFQQVELPELLRNEKVTHINGVEREHLLELAGDLSVERRAEVTQVLAREAMRQDQSQRMIEAAVREREMERIQAQQAQQQRIS